jgi:hypothetical protein
MGARSGYESSRHPRQPPHVLGSRFDPLERDCRPVSETPSVKPAWSYFSFFAVGGSSPFMRRYIAAIEQWQGTPVTTLHFFFQSVKSVLLRYYGVSRF